MNNTVKQVKDQWDIVDEVRKVVQLSKRGQNFVGLCPFHSEKTPSFYVSPSKKRFLIVLAVVKMAMLYHL